MNLFYILRGLEGGPERGPDGGPERGPDEGVQLLYPPILNIHACRHAVASSSKQVLPVNSFIYIYTTYRVHSLEKYSIFSTSTVIDQKTRSVHIYGHLNTYILLFDYRTLLVYTLQLTFKVGVSSVFECYWLMAYNGKANC